MNARVLIVEAKGRSEETGAALQAAVQLAFDGSVSNPPPSKKKPRPEARVLIKSALDTLGAATAEQIARATHLKLSSVAARLGELLRAGLVLPIERELTGSGRWAWRFRMARSIADPTRKAEAQHARAMLLATKGRWNGRATL